MHGYIVMTSLERLVLDTTPAQRMRWIAQSGLAHYVFPDVRTSRFIHSLGAMHLASRFLAASLHRAPADARHAAQEGIKAAVLRAVGSVGGVRPAASQLDDDGLLTSETVSDAFRPYVLIAEQGLRLAALFHDLGHLPFSHDFEYAISQLAGEDTGEVSRRARPLLAREQGRDALHERIGHNLTYLLFDEVFAYETTESARVSFAFARLVLQADEAKPGHTPKDEAPAELADGVLAWLHTLIDGELDVDRCDYVLRDARCYGFEFARFDLERLIDNLIVVRDPEIENALVPAVRPQGHAAVESFLIARARMYQWGPRHHKVAQVGAALQYAIATLLRPALVASGSESEHTLAPFLRDLETILEASPDKPPSDPSQLLARFAAYDDQWWMSYMRSQHRDNEWLNFVCWRAQGPRSLWKRALDFPADDLASWNARLPERTDLAGLGRWDAAVRSLREDEVLVIRHAFQPWKASEVVGGTPFESALSFFDTDHGLTPVSRMSPHIAALRQTWLSDVQVHAFAGRDTAVSAEDVVARLSSAIEGAYDGNDDAR